ncbi:hypothetical protein CJNNKLLH_2595 [Methylorubrum thiocyanatum]|nr:hypothetical protein CJNNKLLH_2595 [Methylorubrum thiocyanatum]
MGGTNPHALQEVKATIRKRDDLHAKVYIGAKAAIVASANVSSNGLGLQGVEQAGWIEAGVIVEDIAALSDWFDKLWLDSDQIGPADWKAAEEAWRARTKPTVVSFAYFDAEASDLPLLNWLRWVNWNTNRDAIAEKFGAVTEGLVRQVDGGLELEHPADEAVLVGRWVLCWDRGKKASALMKGRPWWVRLGSTVLRGAFSLDGEDHKRDVVMAVEKMPPVPFDPTEERFLAAFRAVLVRPQYAALLEEDYEAPWFKPRQEIIASAWRDIKAEYLRS